MRRSTTGRHVSQSSAMTTMAVATSAATIGGALRRAPGGAREEDDPVGVARDLVEGLDHRGLAATGAPGDRHGGPHAGVELPAELLDQRQFLGGDLDVSLGDQLLAVPRSHPQELHSTPIMPEV